MKSIITAFGRDYRVAPLKDEEASFFYRLPPVRFDPKDTGFKPDPYAFIVSDSVLMDVQSFDKLTKRANPAYRAVAEFFVLAKEEGLLETVDYESVLSQKRGDLNQMVERDLGDTEGWMPVMEESQRIWRELSEMGASSISSAEKFGANFAVYDGKALRTELGFQRDMAVRLAHNPHMSFHNMDHLFEKAFKLQENEFEEMRNQVGAYLSYVNANLLLANHFRAGVYDWADITPYYRDKFARVASPAPVNHEVSRGLEQVFSVLFPTLSFEEPERLVKLLKNPHLAELRKLCADAAVGDVTFDQDFVNRIMNEIFDIYDNQDSFGEVLSWFGFAAETFSGLEGLLPKPLEALVTKAVESKVRAPFNWFFLMRDYSKRR